MGLNICGCDNSPGPSSETNLVNNNKYNKVQVSQQRTIQKLEQKYLDTSCFLSTQNGNNTKRSINQNNNLKEFEEVS